MKATVRRTRERVNVTCVPRLVNETMYYVTDDERVFTEYELTNVRL